MSTLPRPRRLAATLRLFVVAPPKLCTCTGNCLVSIVLHLQGPLCILWNLQGPLCISLYLQEPLCISLYLQGPLCIVLLL